MWRLIFFFGILFSSCHSVKVPVVEDSVFASAETFQLVPPKVLTDFVLFRKNTIVELAMDFPGTEIRYTLDGSPVNRNATLYNNKLTINKTGTLKALAFHPECQTSEKLVQPFYKIQTIFDRAKITLNPSADSRYAGNGVSTLTDLKKGKVQFRGEQRWLGFQKDTVDIQIDFAEKTSLESIIVSALANEIAWIFLPGRIELLEGETVFAFVNKETLKNPSVTGSHFITIDFPKKELENLTIRVLSDPLPEGHNGFGYTAWFFVDEVFAVFE